MLWVQEPSFHYTRLTAEGGNGTVVFAVTEKAFERLKVVRVNWCNPLVLVCLTMFWVAFLGFRHSEWIYR